MSLIRQIWCLLLGTLLVAWLASVAVNASSARDLLQTQLRAKNSDNAAAIALVLSQQGGRLGLMEMTAQAQFDTGLYRRIRFVGADGQTLFGRDAAPAASSAPAWFVAALPIESVPGVAQVADGWRALGSIEVVSESAYAHDALWRGSLHGAFVLAVVGVVAGLLASLAIVRVRRPLDATVAQAVALQRGEYLTVAEPRVPELRRLTRAMNAMVGRLRVVFESQAEQVEALRRQATCDALTGVLNRTAFMARLRAALQREDGQAESGLLLLRLSRLADVNRELGRDGTDRLIAGVATTLQGYAERVDNAFVGRLNGSDFALVLPRGGVALETAGSVLQLLRVQCAGVATQVSVAAGAVELDHSTGVTEAMGAADLALARAEVGPPFGVESSSVGAGGWAARSGERGWRQRLQAALANGRARLAAYPVVDADGALLHLECPMRVQLEPNGAFEVAAQWLPLAIRGGLSGAIDQRALALALAAIERDGRPRSVNLSPASLADSAFGPRLREQLLAAPRAAALVWLEVDEAAAAHQFELVRALGRQVRPTGAKFGLEHAGERLGRIDRLYEAGLDYVKLDGSVIEGVSRDADRAGHVRGLCTWAAGLNIRIYAEGVDSADDARVLWALGLDGLTGPWVSSLYPQDAA